MNRPPAAGFQRGRPLVEGGWEFAGDDHEGRPVRLVVGDTELSRAYLGLVIGRHPELADRVVADAAVSRRHCRIGLADGGLFVEDLNSLNGTAVDDTWLAPFRPVAVGPGQRLRFGRLRVVVTRLAEGQGDGG